MREHRIKETNADKVMSALSQKNINAEIVPAPLSNHAFRGEFTTGNGCSWDTADMVGICCPLSGQQFHRLLVEIGVVEK